MGQGATKEEKAEMRKKYGVPEKSYDAIVHEFNSMATPDGRVSRDMFRMKMAKELGNADLAGQYFDAFDVDHSGSINMHEWLLMVGLMRGGSREEKLRGSFKLFDKDNSNSLSKDEVIGMLRIVRRNSRIPSQRKFPLTEKEELEVKTLVDEVFRRIDIDKNGELSIDEFVAGFAEHPDVCKFFDLI
eukprot:m51a1_g3541 putative ef hand domain containing protein (187) ;mRNA; r:983117-984093